MGLGTHSADLHARARLMVGAGAGYTGERRTDSVAVAMGATPVETRPDGSKVYEGAASFGDVVKRYPDLTPPRNEFIPADEAMSPEALATLEGLRFTAGTRSKDWDGKVTLAADHTPELDDPNGEAIEGAVLRGWREDSAVPGEPPALKVRVIVYTRAAQDLLERGVRDLSFGFRTDEERKDGVHAGVPYQRVQRNIRYYHLALVTSARSRTPSGRRARFDSYPTPTAVAAGETPPMKPKHLLLSAVAALTGKALPPAPTVPDVDDAGKPRVDAYGAPVMVEDAAAGPALSEADAALLKQMSPEAQAALGAALGAAVAEPIEVAEESGEEAAEEEAEVSADVEQDTEMLAPVLADIAAIKAALEAAGIKVGAPKGDEMPMPSAMKMDTEVKAQIVRNKAEMQALRADIAKGDPGGLLQARLDGLAVATASLTKPTARKDSAVMTTPAKPAITIDADAIIKAAETAASKRFDANAAFVQVVRNDHSDVATVEQAATVMLTTIKAHLPDLSGMAEEALKGGRFDSLTVFYKQAEGIRRDSLLARQGADLGRVLASADLGTNAGGNVVRAPGRS